MDNKSWLPLSGLLKPLPSSSFACKFQRQCPFYETWSHTYLDPYVLVPNLTLIILFEWKQNYKKGCKLGCVILMNKMLNASCIMLLCSVIWDQGLRARGKGERPH